MSLNLRIRFASFAFLLLLFATVCLVAFVIMERDIGPSIPTLAMFAFIWVISIPNMVKLRRMVAEQRRGLR